MPGKLVLMRTELHTACSGGPEFRDLEKPLMAKHNRNYHVVVLRSPYLGSPWRSSQLTTTHELARLLDTAMALQLLLGACSFWEPPPLLLLPHSGTALEINFFPSDKAHTDGALSATIKGLRWVMENGRTWHVLVCLSAIFP